MSGDSTKTGLDRKSISLNERQNCAHGRSCAWPGFLGRTNILRGLTDEQVEEISPEVRECAVRMA